MSKGFGSNKVSINNQDHRDELVGDDLTFTPKYGQESFNDPTNDFNKPAPEGHSQVPNKPVNGWNEDDRGEVKDEWHGFKEIG